MKNEKVHFGPLNISYSECYLHSTKKKKIEIIVRIFFKCNDHSAEDCQSSKITSLSYILYILKYSHTIKYFKAYLLFI